MELKALIAAPATKTPATFSAVLRLGAKQAEIIEEQAAKITSDAPKGLLAETIRPSMAFVTSTRWASTAVIIGCRHVWRAKCGGALMKHHFENLKTKRAGGLGEILRM